MVEKVKRWREKQQQLLRDPHDDVSQGDQVELNPCVALCSFVNAIPLYTTTMAVKRSYAAASAAFKYLNRFNNLSYFSLRFEKMFEAVVVWGTLSNK